MHRVLSSIYRTYTVRYVQDLLTSEFSSLLNPYKEVFAERHMKTVHALLTVFFHMKKHPNASIFVRHKFID